MGAITDNGTGDYTLGFDTAFNNTNYWIAGFARTNGDNARGLFTANASGGKTASAIEIVTASSVTSGGIDSPEVGIAAWGDYA